jgi:hypothetical protein
VPLPVGCDIRIEIGEEVGGGIRVHRRRVCPGLPIISCGDEISESMLRPGPPGSSLHTASHWP